VDDLLYLCHRIPYPPDKGDKIRSWHILERLAGRYRVHLGCFVDDPDDWRHVETLRVLCADTCFARLAPRWARLRSLVGLLDGRPLTLPYYRSQALETWVADLCARVRPRRIVVFSSAMAQFVMPPASEETPTVRRVIDFVDVDSEKWRAYAEKRRGLDRWIYAREGRRLLAYERRVAAAFDASLFVSEAEAALFRRLAPEVASKVGYMSNGVDCAYFSPDRAYENPYEDRDGPVLVFTGAMDYWANVDAVTWFADAVLPLVRVRHPKVWFYIVGARPAPEVRRLAGRDRIAVTGRVDDVRPYLAHAHVAVAPLRIARGVQNKVLEAMAMAKAVVATSAAVEGILVESGKHLKIADNEENFSEKLHSLLTGDDRESLGIRARQQVIAAHAWTASLNRLDEVLEASRHPCDNKERKVPVGGAEKR